MMTAILISLAIVAVCGIAWIALVAAFVIVQTEEP